MFKDQNRNRGAGSRALVDKIVLMINRMSTAKADEDEETFTFDAVEIFDRQYQPKFCASVQATVRRYRHTATWLSTFGTFIKGR